MLFRLKNNPLFTLLFAAVLLFAGCSSQQPKPGLPVIFTGIMPHAYFAERIAGPNAEVHALVGPGQNPHTYSPAPAQVVRLSRARIYFRAGVEFEKGFVGKLPDINPDLKIVDLRDGIRMRKMEEHSDEEEGSGADTPEDHPEHGAAEEADENDPHIWMDPRLAKIQAMTICSALVSMDSVNAGIYRTNCTGFLLQLDSVDAKLRIILSPLRGKNLFVFHAAFGYFAEAYGLKQVPVQIGGKEPGGYSLARLIDKARAQNVRVIFVQPQFSSKNAKAIAEAINGAVVPLNDLAKDYLENMRRMANLVEKALEGQR